MQKVRYLSSHIAQMVSTLENNSASQRAIELIQLFDSGDRKTAKAYIKNNYAPEFLEIPMEVHLNIISTFPDQTRGIKSYQMQKSSPSEATLLVQSKLTHGWVAITIMTESTSPYRINKINFERADLPKEMQATEKISNSEITVKVDEYLQTLSASDVFSGTVLLAQYGKIFYKKAFGVADKNFNVPNNIDTKFNLGSMNKMFTIKGSPAGGGYSTIEDLLKFDVTLRSNLFLDEHCYCCAR